MKSISFFVVATLLVSASSSYAKVRTPSEDDQLQAACYPDVQRLCKDAIPDEGKIRTCMEGKKSMISAKCKKAYKATQD